MGRNAYCFRRSTLGLALVACLMGQSAWAAEKKSETGQSAPDVLVWAEPQAEVLDSVVLEAGEPNETFDSFIVYYRGDAEPGDDDSKAAKDTLAMLQKDLERANARLSLKAKQERRLATGGHLLRLSGALDKNASRDFMIEIAANPEVEVIEPNALQYAFAAPNDTYYSRQWGLHDARGGINIERAWNSATGNNVVIAILDTGRTSHPDLNSKTVAGYDFISDAARARDGNGRDSNPNDAGDWVAADECRAGSPARDSSWHGMHVAGIAGAITNNGRGIAGTARRAKIQHVRVLGKCGGTTADIAEGIIWASGGRVSGVPANATPARVLNLSLGGEGACGETYQRAINSARSRNSVVVVAAGNDASPVSGARPANCTGVIAVAATNREGRRSNYSNYGSGIDIAAPGGEGSGDGRILSLVDSGTQGPVGAAYGGKNGTSMATPFVSGVVAMMLERRPSLTPNQVENIIRNTARPFPTDCTGGCGPGIVDANEAVRVARGGAISRYPVSVALYGTGSGTVTSSPSGISCGSSCSSRFNKNATVTLRATPSSGARFSGWGGACRGTSTTCTLNINEAKTAFATFNVPVRTLSNGSVRNNLSASGNTRLLYKLPVPAGATNLRVQISGGTGDADLYVRHGSEPQRNAYDCRPYVYGNNETCTFPAPMAGDYYIMLEGDPSFSGVRLSTRYTTGTRGGPLLTAGSTRTGINIPKGGARYYRLNVPSGARNLRIETSGGTGDLDLYVRRSAVPTRSTYGCASRGASNSEVCRSTASTAGMYYIMLYGSREVQGARLRGSYTRSSNAAATGVEEVEDIWFEFDEDVDDDMFEEMLDDMHEGLLKED